MGNIRSSYIGRMIDWGGEKVDEILKFIIEAIVPAGCVDAYKANKNLNTLFGGRIKEIGS